MADTMSPFPLEYIYIFFYQYERDIYNSRIYVIT